MNKLPLSFYKRDDVVLISKELLGNYLFTQFNGSLTGGIIVETEAYCGRDDRASHAYNGRRTGRTEIMYQTGGLCYVYLCYGIHHLFNVVTNVENLADAILIRAIQPTHGIDHMKQRRLLKDVTNNRFASGPGTLSQALGISRENNGESLNGDRIWIAKGHQPDKNHIVTSLRINVKYAGNDALRPWRFTIKDNSYIGRI